MGSAIRGFLAACWLVTMPVPDGALAASPRPPALPPADGAADARKDFDAGIHILLGGEGVEPGMLDLGGGLTLEIATDACALGPDPAGYIADYNISMKRRILEVYGVDVDNALLRAAP